MKTAYQTEAETIYKAVQELRRACERWHSCAEKVRDAKTSLDRVRKSQEEAFFDVRVAQEHLQGLIGKIDDIRPF